jgi:hypothetical protein
MILPTIFNLFLDLSGMVPRKSATRRHLDHARSQKRWRCYKPCLELLEERLAPAHLELSSPPGVTEVVFANAGFEDLGGLSSREAHFQGASLAPLQASAVGSGGSSAGCQISGDVTGSAGRVDVSALANLADVGLISLANAQAAGLLATITPDPGTNEKVGDPVTISGTINGDATIQGNSFPSGSIVTVNTDIFGGFSVGSNSHNSESFSNNYHIGDTLPFDINVLLQLERNGAGGLSGSADLHISWTITANPSVGLDNVVWNDQSPQGGVTVNYHNGASSPADVELYWSHSPGGAPIGLPIQVFTTDASNLKVFPKADLLAEGQQPPPGAEYVVAQVLGKSGKDSVKSVGMPNLESLSIDYEVDLNHIKDGLIPVGSKFPPDKPLEDPSRFTLLNLRLVNGGGGIATGTLKYSIYAANTANFTPNNGVLLAGPFTLDQLSLDPGEPITLGDPGMNNQHIDIPLSATAFKHGPIYIRLFPDTSGLREVASVPDTTASLQPGVDYVMADLADPIPPSNTVAYTNTSIWGMIKKLKDMGFIPINTSLLDWVKPLSHPVTSPFDGQPRSGNAYYDLAFVTPRALGSFTVKFVGDENVGIPNPLTAAFFGSDWFNYVFKWHQQFGYN